LNSKINYLTLLEQFFNKKVYSSWLSQLRHDSNIKKVLEKHFRFRQKNSHSDFQEKNNSLKRESDIGLNWNKRVIIENVRALTAFRAMIRDQNHEEVIQKAHCYIMDCFLTSGKPSGWRLENSYVGYRVISHNIIRPATRPICYLYYFGKQFGNCFAVCSLIISENL